jgi:hypothetical protein
MMKRAVTLVVISLVLLTVSGAGYSQDISFHGSDIMQLARTIVTSVKQTNRLPSAYALPMTGGQTMVITAPNAYELLVRATITWKEHNNFPTTVSLLLHDLVGPAPEPKLEPARDGLVVGVPTMDIGNYAAAWLAMAEAPGHKLPKAMTFETGYRLTAAQIIVAMAMLIDETLREEKFPIAIAVPLVRAPQNWLDTAKPVTVIAAQTPAPPAPQADLHIRLNGIELSESGPLIPGTGALPTFCGTIRVDLSGTGPVNTIRVLLDGNEVQLFKGVGPHYLPIDSPKLTDGTHMLSLTLTDEAEITYFYIFSFTVHNGRRPGFTPAEPHVQQIDVTPK